MARSISHASRPRKTILTPMMLNRNCRKGMLRRSGCRSIVHASIPSAWFWSTYQVRYLSSRRMSPGERQHTIPRHDWHVCEQQRQLDPADHPVAGTPRQQQNVLSVVGTNTRCQGKSSQYSS